MTDINTQEKKERAVLVGLDAFSLPREENATQESMDELAALLETAGGQTAAVVMQSKDSPDPRTFIGEGKVAEVKELVHAMDADMVIFDNSLSPSQQRVLSEELNVSVLDRSALILDIFAQRARTREGRLQVELAQYKYLLPRLTGMWKHLERQEGAIGTRGPGETQLESDRRHIHRKIAKLEGELKDVRRVRATQRDRRIKNEVPVVAIVGYTNAGKSTLLNRLTGADIPANNRLFDTLDTTTRTLEISDTCTVLLSDTVGFIRKLPQYHVPSLKGVLLHVGERVWAFLKKAGTILFVCCAVMWFLGSFGIQDGVFGLVDTDYCFLATIGGAIAWIFAPLGFGTWQAVASSLSGFVAKEGIVSTMGVLSGLGEIEEYAPDMHAQFAAFFPTSLSAISFLLFNLFDSPCLAAISTTAKEIGSRKFFWFAIVFQNVMAYAISLMVYQLVGLALGEVQFGAATVAAAIVLVLILYFLFRPDPAKQLQRRAAATHA